MALGRYVLAKECAMSAAEQPAFAVLKTERLSLRFHGSLCA
jgi:hypothetical protein